MLPMPFEFAGPTMPFKFAGPTFHQWVNYKTKPTQFGDNKNTPSGKYDPKPVVLEAPQVDDPATTPSEPTTGDFNANSAS